MFIPSQFQADKKKTIQRHKAVFPCQELKHQRCFDGAFPKEQQCLNLASLHIAESAKSVLFGLFDQITINVSRLSSLFFDPADVYILRHLLLTIVTF